MTEFEQHIADRGYLEGMPNIVVDYDNEVVVFLLYSTTGVFIGYQNYFWKAEKERSNKGRYFTWLTEEYKPMSVWGWHSLSKFSEQDVLFIVEGMWDAVRVHGAGYACLAVLTATPQKQTIEYIKQNSWRRTKIGLIDNDENGAGLGVAKFFEHNSITPKPYKDLGDMPPHIASAYLEGVRREKLAAEHFVS